MKREYLEGLDLGNGVKLSKEQIDAIMAENGRDIEAAKKPFADYEDLKKQLAEAGTTIEGFKKLDVEGIKKAADEWKTKAETAEREAAAKIEKLTYDTAAEKYIDTLKPKDALSKKAILAEFTSKGFKLDGENFVGAKEWSEQFKKDNASHFDDGKPTPGIFSGKVGGPGQSANPDAFMAALRKGAGLPDAPANNTTPTT